MKLRTIVFSLLAASLAAGASGQKTKTMTVDELRDRIAGGWAGKMIGVSFGAPSEFRAQGKTFEEKLSWTPGGVNNSLGQDDIYVQLSFMMTMDRFGIDAPAEKFAESFATAGYPLWHANAQARKNFFDGIMPPLSGSPEYNLHADDIDFQIEADYIGFICPGMPRTAGALAEKVGHIMNYGDGVYGGVFVGALYTRAFFETDIGRLVDEALLSIPEKSEYAQCIRDVVLLHRRFPDDWREAWKRLEAKWGTCDICGALEPFNIDAKLNGAYIVMGLLYGGGDFGKTMEIALHCGQDSDCNPSNAAAVIGVMKGMRAIPDEWKGGIPAIADSLFIFTGYTFNTAVENTLKYAERLITENGGKVEGGTVTIKLQQPKAPRLEESFPGMIATARIPATDSGAWTFKGKWESGGTRVSDEKGAEAVFTFTGTGVAVQGGWSEDGGKADVFVDGKPSRVIDTWFNQPGGYSLWQTFQLKPGKHTVRIVVSGMKRPESTGTKVGISSGIVFTTGKKSFEGMDVRKME
jgi:hypothetical protein